MASIQRKIRNRAKRELYRLFRIGQRCGVDILPRHFYSSIPDFRHLERSSYWRRPTSMTAVPGAGIDGQKTFVTECCSPDLRARLQQMDVYGRACQQNGTLGYGQAEAEFLYCFIHSHRPQKIVQIGAGVSTAVILHAAEDAGFTIDLTCIDPFPGDYLRRMQQAGKIALIAEPAQEVELGAMTELGDHAMLFVDSTHTVKVGSEVNRIILEVLPRLPINTFVHFHDIFFPYDYQRSILTELFFTQENALLHAFLACNNRYTIRAALSMLHYADPALLRECLPNYHPAAETDGVEASGVDGHFPSAIYIQAMA